MSGELTERQERVLRALVAAPTTPDEFVAQRRLYINTWAPVFTRLKKAGLIARTGLTRVTEHGGTAHVLTITEDGRTALAQHLASA